MTVTLRPLGYADIPAFARLLAAVEAVDQTGEHYNEADLHEEFDNPDIEVGRDILGAFASTDDDAEEIVGYASVYPRAADETYLKYQVEGAVLPIRRGEGIGSRLVDAMLARVRESHLERAPEMPVKVSLTGLSANSSQAELLAAAGFVAERWNFVMRTHLGAVDAPPALPDGLELRRYEPSLSTAMHEAHNEAFLDHPNFTPWTDVMWKQWVTDSRNFRPDLSLVAVDPTAPDRVVAYIQSNEYDAYFQATGTREAYVAKVGTRRDYRGRGLAGALLQHVLALYQEAGYDEASLDVDSENPTGALGIYERVGFTVESRWTNYALTFGPATS